MQKEFNLINQSLKLQQYDGVPYGAAALSYNWNMKLYSSTHWVPLGPNIHTLCMCEMLEMSRFIWSELRWRSSGDVHKAFEDTSAHSLCIAYGNVCALNMHESIDEKASNEV